MAFYKTQLETEILISRLQRYPSLYKVFKKKKDLTKETDEDIKLRIHGEIDNFVVILCEGNQGSVKSGLAQQIASENEEKFNAQRISFEYEEFRQAIENSKKGEWYILDEEIFSHGTGSSRILQSVQNLIETLRQHGANMILISPTPKYFPENIFTHHLETIDRSITGICDDNNERHDIRSCKNKQHREIKAKVRACIKKDGEYLGFYIKEIAWGTKLWQDYQVKKKIFLTKAMKEEYTKMNYKEIAEKLLNEPEAEKYKTRTEMMLYLEEKMPNLTIGEKNLIISSMKMIRREEE